jgi:inosine-uridine nucleoside N-ribohydrolase
MARSKGVTAGTLCVRRDTFSSTLLLSTSTKPEISVIVGGRRRFRRSERRVVLLEHCAKEEIIVVRGCRAWKWMICLAACLCAGAGLGQSRAAPEKIIIDTDIGDDIDDAFALALAVKSPELQVLGVTTTFGDTETRAKIADRFLGEIGRAEIPVLAGKATATKNPMSQRRYVESGRLVKASHGDVVDFLLEQIRKYPGGITLVAIGPLMNVGAAIDKDAATFRKLKRVVLMGGSIRRGYGDLGYTAPVPPMPEWNILNDVASAQKLFASGVPLFVMPLDSTQLKMDEVKRAFLFSQGTVLSDQLAVLYHLWGQETPTLFDPMTLVYMLRPELCPVKGMHIRVDEKGFTREDPGASNAQVCLDSNGEDFFKFYLKRMAER